MQWQNLVRQKTWKSTATMDLQFLPDMKGGAREVGGIGARGGRAGGGPGVEELLADIFSYLSGVDWMRYVHILKVIL